MKKEYLQPSAKTINLMPQHIMTGSVEVGKGEGDFNPESMTFTRRRMWMDDEE